MRLFLVTACLGLVACAAPRLVTRAAAQLTPGVTYFVPTEERVVALTIDDGPDPAETPRILEVLAQHEARATFFLIGSRVPGNEALLARMGADSHEVANHTLHERASILLPPEALAAELRATDDLLSPYGSVRWFRPGSGWVSERMLRLASQQGYSTALGDVFPFDPLIPSSRFHAWYILRHVRPGSVIVLHDANGRGARTADTLGVVLPELRERGYRVVTLSELHELAH
jgi:peptidoglycan/xylan/chitin deacetylase (PgdA/CDA1 family)